MGLRYLWANSVTMGDEATQGSKMNVNRMPGMTISSVGRSDQLDLPGARGAGPLGGHQAWEGCNTGSICPILQATTQMQYQLSNRLGFNLCFPR